MSFDQPLLKGKKIKTIHDEYIKEKCKNGPNFQLKSLCQGKKNVNLYPQ